MWLAKAITLVESTLPSDRVLAEALINEIMTQTGQSYRKGITGVPGVGKSTFIESFGLQAIERGHRLAVLAIDPTSQKTGGSILGDKTRMERLSQHPHAYIRPSSAGTSLGGVQRQTRETILLCEAAGFDLILIETVGVGQSETAVYHMADFFLLLMLAGAGDELQGIKRGIMEMADGLLITKADAEDPARLKVAIGDYKRALHLLPPPEGDWKVPVLPISAFQATSLEDVWDMLNQFKAHMQQNGLWERRRIAQRANWLSEAIQHLFELDFFGNETIQARWQEALEKTRNGHENPGFLARQLFEGYLKERKAN